MTKLRVLIERIDGRIQHYNVNEETLDIRGYTETTQYFRDEPSLVWTRFPEDQIEYEGPGEIGPEEEHLYEVVAYTEYKQKRKTRNERYELRTTVRARNPMDAVERGLAKMTRIVPSDHAEYLDGVGIYGVDASEASHEITDTESYRGVKYFRFNAGGETPKDPKYHWSEGM